MNEELTAQLTAAARAHAHERDTLSDRVANLHTELEAVKRRYLPGIRNAASRARETRDGLIAIIEANPEAFTKPRTITLAGIKLGLQKQKGSVSWDNAQALVKAIRKHYPERFDDLVKTDEKPIRAALNKLSVAEARKLGLTVSEDSDAPLVKSAHDDVDKLVSQLLKDDAKQNKEAA